MKKAPPSDRRFFFGVGDRSAVSARALAREFASRMGSSEADLLFPLFLPPSVLAIAPPSGPPAGGTAVTISGANFRPGATVLIGGLPATGVVVNGPTSISCNTTAHASGPATVRVTNVDGQSGRLINGYTYTVAIVTVGLNASFVSFDDGLTWTSNPTMPNGNWSDVCFASGIGFVAVNASGASVATSPDGVTWSAPATTGLPASLSAVTFGAGLFVAVGGTNCFTSPDGVNWTARNINGPAPAGYNDLAYNGSSIFAAVATVTIGTNAASSPDGINWTGQGGASNLLKVRWTGSLFVASSSLAQVWTSANGTAWNNRASPSPVRAIAGINAFITALGTNVAQHSVNGGVNWIGDTSPYDATVTLNRMMWSGTRFIAVGTNGGNATSLNGIDWLAGVARLAGNVSAAGIAMQV